MLRLGHLLKGHAAGAQRVAMAYGPTRATYIPRPIRLQPIAALHVAVYPRALRRDEDPSVTEKGINYVKDKAEQAAEVIKDAAANTSESVKQAAESASDTVKSALGGAGIYAAKEGVKAKGREVTENLKEKIGLSQDDVRDKAENLKDRAENLKDEVKHKARKVKDNVKGKVEDIEESVSYEARDFSGRAEEKGQGLAEDVKHTAQDIKEGVKHKAHGIKEKISHAVDDVQHKVQEGWEKIKGKTADSTKRVRDQANDIAEEFSTTDKQSHARNNRSQRTHNATIDPSKAGYNRSTSDEQPPTHEPSAMPTPDDVRQPNSSQRSG